MPWVRLDDRFPSHRKIATLDDRAFRLYVSALCWSAENLTDGAIGEKELPLVAHIRGVKATAQRLVDAGLWERTETGWQVHDFLDYQYSAEQVRAEREKNAERQRRFRERHGGKPKPPGGKAKGSRSSGSNAGSNGVTDPSESHDGDTTATGQRHDGDTNAAQTRSVPEEEPQVGNVRNAVINETPCPPPTHAVPPNGGTAASSTRAERPPSVVQLAAAQSPDPFADLKAALAAAGLGAVAWDIRKLIDRQRIQDQLARLGIDVMVRSAVAAARNRGEPDSVTAWIGRWESLADPIPQAAVPDADNVVALHRPGHQQQTDDLFDRAMTRAKNRMQQEGK
jgi:hypothetical protein